MNSDNACCSSKGRNKAIGLLVLRVAVGLIFVIHGYGKLFGNMPGMTMFTGMVKGLGFPLPAFFAYVAALAEFLGGIALILGIFTCVAATLLAINMIVAFVGVKGVKLPQGDIEFMLLAAAIALALMGPGMYSLKAKLKMGKMKMMGGKMDEKQGCCNDGASGGCACGNTSCGCNDGEHKH